MLSILEFGLGQRSSYNGTSGKQGRNSLLGIIILALIFGSVLMPCGSAQWSFPYCNYQGTTASMTTTYDLVFIGGAPYLKVTLTNQAAMRYDIILIGQLWIDGAIADPRKVWCIAESAPKNMPVTTYIPLSVGSSCILTADEIAFKPIECEIIGGKEYCIKDNKVWIAWKTSDDGGVCGEGTCGDYPGGQSAYFDSLTVPPVRVVAASNSPVCEGDTIELYGYPDGLFKYSWTGPNGFTSDLQNPTISGADPLTMAGTYTLTGCTDDGCVCSGTDSTEVVIKPTIVLTGPVDQTVCDGGLATFSVTPDNTELYMYQWLVKTAGSTEWVEISGENSPSYSFQAWEADSGNQYRVLVGYKDEPSCIVESDPATLTVRPPITLTGPFDQYVCSEEETVTFSVSPADTETYAYQWQVQESGSMDWNPIEGATQPSYSFTASALDNGNKYRVLVGYKDEPYCEVTSNAAALIFQGPYADAGPDIVICVNQLAYILEAVALNYDTATWTITGGDGEGTISQNPDYPGDPTKVIFEPFGYPLTGYPDKVFVTTELTLTVTALSPCTGSVSDTMNIITYQIPNALINIDEPPQT